jgi:Ca2+-binding RTX toxin-like protein
LAGAPNGSDTHDDTMQVVSGDTIVIASEQSGACPSSDSLAATTNDTAGNPHTAYELTGNVQVLVFVGENGFTGTGNSLANFMSGGSNADILSGMAGDDTLLGGGGDDVLDGGAGADTLDGGDGDDWVMGGQGDDYVVFTRGNDTLVLRPGFGNDVVSGFDTNSRGQGGHDRIDVSAYGFSADSFGVDILLIYDGDSTVVKIGADSVKLVLVDAHTMDRQDFIFS